MLESSHRCCVCSLSRSPSLLADLLWSELEVAYAMLSVIITFAPRSSWSSGFGIGV
jgi:hypothetical protein